MVDTEPQPTAGMVYTPFPASMDFAAASPAQVFGTGTVGQVFRDASPAWTHSEPNNPAIVDLYSLQQPAYQSTAAHQSPPQPSATSAQAPAQPSPAAAAAFQQGSPGPSSPAAQAPSNTLGQSAQPSPDATPPTQPDPYKALALPPTFAAMAPPISSHLAEPTPPPLRQQPLRYVPTQYPFSGLPAAASQLAGPGPSPAVQAPHVAPPTPVSSGPLAALAAEAGIAPAVASPVPAADTLHLNQQEAMVTSPAAAEPAAGLLFGLPSPASGQPAPGGVASAPAAVAAQQPGCVAELARVAASGAPLAQDLPFSTASAAGPVMQPAAAQLSPGHSEISLASLGSPAAGAGGMQAMLHALSLTPTQVNSKDHPQSPDLQPEAASDTKHGVSSQQQPVVQMPADQALPAEGATKDRAQSSGHEPALDSMLGHSPGMQQPEAEAVQEPPAGQAGAEQDNLTALAPPPPASPPAFQRPVPHCMLSPGAISIPSSPVRPSL